MILPTIIISLDISFANFRNYNILLSNEQFSNSRFHLSGDYLDRLTSFLFVSQHTLWVHPHTHTLPTLNMGLEVNTYLYCAG